MAEVVDVVEVVLRRFGARLTTSHDRHQDLQNQHRKLRSLLVSLEAICSVRKARVLFLQFRVNSASPSFANKRSCVSELSCPLSLDQSSFFRSLSHRLRRSLEAKYV